MKIVKSIGVMVALCATALFAVVAHAGAVTYISKCYYQGVGLDYVLPYTITLESDQGYPVCANTLMVSGYKHVLTGVEYSTGESTHY